MPAKNELGRCLWKVSRLMRSLLAGARISCPSSRTFWMRLHSMTSSGKPRGRVRRDQRKLNSDPVFAFCLNLPQDHDSRLTFSNLPWWLVWPILSLIEQIRWSCHVAFFEPGHKVCCCLQCRLLHHNNYFAWNCPGNVRSCSTRELCYQGLYSQREGLIIKLD